MASLIDLEWLLREGAPPTGLDGQRERAIAERAAAAEGSDVTTLRARLDESPELRANLCARWLDAVRARNADLPGRAIVHGLEVCGWLLVILGLLLGAGAARTLLHYDGSTPVNVLHFAVVMFGLQIVLLVLMIWFVVRARRAGTGGGIGLLHRPIAFVAGRMLGARGRAAADALRALRSRHALYADIERWTVFALAQRLGVAFNVGALAVAALTIVFSDLVFAWSTTLEIDAPQVRSMVQVIAWPWAWLPSAVPSLEVVEASQWARMERTFVGGATLEQAIPLAARWWPFLLAGLTAWGLVPRVAALAFGLWRARSARQKVGFDHAGHHELFDRLLPRAQGWAGPAPDAVRGQAPLVGITPSTPHPPSGGARTMLCVWGRLGDAHARVARHITNRLGAEVRGSLAVGGSDLDADDRALAACAEAAAERDFSRVAFVVSAGQQPTAEVLEFLRSLRRAIGASRPIVVGLLEQRADAEFVDAEPDERAIWKRALGALDDAHLWVEQMADVQESKP